MFRYKLLVKQYGYLIFLTIVTILLCVIWYDNFMWIANQCKELK